MRCSSQTGAGNGIDCPDSAYKKAGAEILPDAASVFKAADMIVKVKEPQPQEIALLEPRHILFTYLHLAADKPQAEGLMKSGATCIAYETVTSTNGALPLLKPMSEVAGRMSVQVGAHYLEKEQGGRGVLLGGVPGVAPAKVAILGGGVAGVNAAQMATGMRADVTIYDINNERLAELDMFFSSQIKTAYASRAAIANAVEEAELVIGAVLVPGAAAPKLVTREMLKTMKRGSVLVDIAIDQGGCFETSPCHDARRSGLRGRRHHPLLRRQHAGRGGADQRLRAQQCDPAVRAEDREPRGGGSDAAGPAPRRTVSTSRAARSGTRRSPKRSTCLTSRSRPEALAPRSFEGRDRILDQGAPAGIGWRLGEDLPPQGDGRSARRPSARALGRRRSAAPDSRAPARSARR